MAVPAARLAAAWAALWVLAGPVPAGAAQPPGAVTGPGPLPGVPLVSYRLWWVDVGPLLGREAAERVRRASPSALLGDGTWVLTADLWPQLAEFLSQRSARSPAGFTESQAAAGEVVGSLGSAVRVELGSRPVLVELPRRLEPEVVETRFALELVARSVDDRGRVETAVRLQAAGKGKTVDYAHTVWLSQTPVALAVVVHDEGPVAYALAVQARRVDRLPSEAPAVVFAALGSFEERAFALLRSPESRQARPPEALVGLEASAGDGPPGWELRWQQPLSDAWTLAGEARWQHGSGGPGLAGDVAVDLAHRLIHELDLVGTVGAAWGSTGSAPQLAVGVGLQEVTRPLPGLSLRARWVPLLYSPDPAGGGRWVAVLPTWAAGLGWQADGWGVEVEASRRWPRSAEVEVAATARAGGSFVLRVGYRYDWETGQGRVVVGLLAIGSDGPGALPSGHGRTPGTSALADDVRHSPTAAMPW